MRSLFGLSSSEVQELLEYFDCFVGSDRDPDMQGFLVRLSSFIVNICLAILIKWSHEDLESSVGIVFVQVFTILLATFITMRNKSLSLSDSHFALVLTISPLAVYFVYVSLRYLLVRRRPGRLYLRLGRGYRHIVLAASFIMLGLWIALQLLIYFARESVFDVEDVTFHCSTPTVKSWLFYRFIEALIYINWSYILVLIVPIIFLVYVLRHFVDIWIETRRRWARVKWWKHGSWLQKPFVANHLFFKSLWLVVTHSHQWFFFLIVFTVYLSWAGAIGMPYLSMSYFYQLASDSAHAMFDEPPVDFPPNPDGPDDSVEKIMSFGQILAGSAMLQPLYQVVRLAWLNRHNILFSFKRLPRWFWDGVVYFFTGHRNPWEEIRRRKEQKDMEMDSIPYSPVEGNVGERSSHSIEDIEKGGAGKVGVADYRRQDSLSSQPPVVLDQLSYQQGIERSP